MTELEPERRPMQIVTAADGNYLHYLACLLGSLGERGGPHQSMDVTVIHRGISREAQRDLQKLIPHPHQLFWVEVDPNLLSTIGFPREFNTCSPHYFRLLAPFLLPNHDRAIYLDADTMVLDDIFPLWTIDLEGHPVAAVPDYLGQVSDAIENWEELQLNPNSPYFNSGVLVMDLTKWRAERIPHKVFAICQKHEDKLLAQRKWPQFDQYGLNAVLENRWKALDQTWNRGTDLPAHPARVVHFIGNGKVGLTTCQPIFHQLFFNVLSRTPYKDWRPGSAQP